MCNAIPRGNFFTNNLLYDGKTVSGVFAAAYLPAQSIIDILSDISGAEYSFIMTIIY
jgi:hypothetical protein